MRIIDIMRLIHYIINFITCMYAHAGMLYTSPKLLRIERLLFHSITVGVCAFSRNDHYYYCYRFE